MNVTVPVGSTATVYIPANSDEEVTESGSPAASSEYVDLVGLEDSYAVYRVESGEYRFRSTIL